VSKKIVKIIAKTTYNIPPILLYFQDNISNPINKYIGTRWIKNPINSFQKGSDVLKESKLNKLINNIKIIAKILGSQNKTFFAFMLFI